MSFYNCIVTVWPQSLPPILKQPFEVRTRENVAPPPPRYHRHKEQGKNCLYTPTQILWSWSDKLNEQRETAWISEGFHTAAHSPTPHPHKHICHSPDRPHSSRGLAVMVDSHKLQNKQTPQLQFTIGEKLTDGVKKTQQQNQNTTRKLITEFNIFLVFIILNWQNYKKIILNCSS